jgi:hypothetical protein
MSRGNKSSEDSYIHEQIKIIDTCTSELARVRTVTVLSANCALSLQSAYQAYTTCPP